MRSHLAAEVASVALGESITLGGWVQRRRDHGGVIFIDLRDRSGLVQVVFDPQDKAVFSFAESLRSEYVIQVSGVIRARPEGTVNPKMQTGKIEVYVQKLQVLNTCESMPFQINDAHEDNISDEVRGKYRVLDLRRPRMQHNLRLRAKVLAVIRQTMEKNDFVEVETPVLGRATPEGARDYIVPSRTHLGSCFALPQSPQIFKQLLMVGGMERYYQVVKCFRDEDLRADRQPEFTQLDLEMSFVQEHEVMSLLETIFRRVFESVLSVKLPEFITLSYTEVMQRYGSDKPDLRNPLVFISLDDLFRDIEFKVFAQPAKDAGSRVVGLLVPGGAGMSRKAIDDYTKLVGQYGAKGLAYIKVNDLALGIDGLQSPIVKFIGPKVIEKLLSLTQAKTGDLLFFGAGATDIVNQSMSVLRDRLGVDLNLLTCAWAPLWVVDFPMFETDYSGPHPVRRAVHHPFTAPAVASIEELKENDYSCLARAYDIVLNGYELGSGSIRIHDRSMQLAVLEKLNIPLQQAQEEFGHLLDALSFGCPPHAGIAFGIDRLLMLLCGAESIREVIAFPKTQNASCLLTKSPSPIGKLALDELGLAITEGIKAE